MTVKATVQVSSHLRVGIILIKKESPKLGKIAIGKPLIDIGKLFINTIMVMLVMRKELVQ